MDFLIRGARVVDPANGIDEQMDVAVSGGKIAAVGPRLEAGGVSVLDAVGLCLFPGLVDVHVHLREPGHEYKETIATGTRAAAAGGFTSIACMPNTEPVNDNAEVTKYILGKAAKQGVCRVYPVGAVSKGLKGEDLSEMGELAEAGCVAVTDDGRPVSSSLVMRRAMEYARGFGLTVISHCEDLDLVDGGCVNEGPTASILGLPASPPEAEEAMVVRDILLARRTGARLHLAHLSTEGSLGFLRWAKELGLPVTGETAPHYFSFTSESVRGFDSNFKMNPPLREAADIAAIQKAVAEGVLDAIATDHAPHAADEKELEFEAAANGVIGLETSLAASLKLYHDGVAPLSAVIAALTCGPAKALGLSGGSLSIGSPADMVLVDIGAEYEIDSASFYSKARNCPFDGMKVKGKTVRTVVGGKTVYLEGKILADNLQAENIL